MPMPVSPGTFAGREMPVAAEAARAGLFISRLLIRWRTRY